MCPVLKRKKKYHGREDHGTCLRVRINKTLRESVRTNCGSPHTVEKTWHFPYNCTQHCAPTYMNVESVFNCVLLTPLFTKSDVLGWKVCKSVCLLSFENDCDELKLKKKMLSYHQQDVVQEAQLSTQYIPSHL